MDQPRPPDREPIFNLPGIIVVTAVAMIAIHVSRGFLTPDDDWAVLAWFAFVPERYVPGAVHLGYPGGFATEVWTFVTYAFLHADATHLLVNVPMYAAVGAVVTRRIGSTRFIAFFVATAAASALAHLWVHPGADVPVVGASGVISGLLGSLLRFGFGPGGLMSPDRYRGDERDAQWPGFAPAASLAAVLTNRRALQFIGIFLLTNLLLVLGSDLFLGPGASIAWEAHLGGFAAGLLFFPLFDRRRATAG